MSEWRRPGSTVRVDRRRFGPDGVRRAADVVATEEPLEIRVGVGPEERTAAVTMRTPGNDFELAAGFLFSEGVVAGPEEVARIRYCTSPPQHYNVVRVDLRREQVPDLAALERYGAITSACGVCGKASLEQLDLRGTAPLGVGWSVPVDLVCSLPEAARAAQGIFEATGGLHAAALFDRGGHLLAVREDVGRHNAVDKLIGWALLERRLPASEAILLVSGRASFELVQKSLVAGIPFLAAVSAPSSLAVETAARFGMTLVAFLRPPAFNVYAGPERLAV